MKTKILIYVAVIMVLVSIGSGIYITSTIAKIQVENVELAENNESLDNNLHGLLDNLETAEALYNQLQQEYDDLVAEYNITVDELSAYKEIATRKSESSYMDIEIPEIPEGCLGYMYIPTCDVSAFIRYGSTPEAISNYHIGEFENSEEIGVGNYSVCGHSSTTKQLIFSKLESIGVGDPIYIYKGDTLYKFSADYMRDVDPEDTWVVSSTGTEYPTCTIVCCTDSGKRRFVVFGNLVKSEKIEDSEN